MELKDTVELMNSQDYKKRFLAEYYQLKIRIDKLEKFIKDWKKGTLSITPSSTIEIHELQFKKMNQYFEVLELRKINEKIN